ncbi:hypothetical protein TorRG33x02_187490 [Trema orientale]|uniref:Uncharacterized protein n=1 Tax=Trema orientale TaxID=63057 RepID=A0A2P5EIV8_TREOI|nr:hypothetical protein TorRG33x02_187490 [Trema orientale]
MAQELQNAEHDPPSYLASNCLKSFHGHCEKNNPFTTNYIVVFFFIFCFKKQKSENQKKKKWKEKKNTNHGQERREPRTWFLGQPSKKAKRAKYRNR